MTVTSALPNKTALEGLDAAMKEAARAVPPLWPLSSSVAVNPFLGQAGRRIRRRRARGRIWPMGFTPTHFSTASWEAGR